MSKKVKSYRFGLYAELVSIAYLFITGHKILAWRYKTHFGEIDIIAKRAAIIKFIEVKARKDSSQSEVLTVYQQKRIGDAAKLFLQRNRGYEGMDMRFDLIIFNSSLSIKYIKNAWESSS